MSETKTVKVLLKDGAIRECTVVVSGAPPWKLLFSGMEFDLQEFSGADLFEALNALRVALENSGAQLLCVGARPDVFPSGMSRGMGGGRKAYLTRIGTPALRTDLVDIFDYAGPEIVSTIVEQNAFHEKWATSFRR